MPTAPARAQKVKTEDVQEMFGNGGEITNTPEVVIEPFDETPVGHPNPEVIGTQSVCDGNELGQLSTRRPARRRRIKYKVMRGASKTARLVAKVSGVGLMLTMIIVALLHWPPWVITNENKRHQVMSLLFVVGIFSVAVEEIIGVNKSALMCLMAATMWTFLGVGYRPMESTIGAERLHEELAEGLQGVGSIILFLLPAMCLVESMDHFDGFAPVLAVIRILVNGEQKRMLPILCIFTFFLSSVIDNLTATIVSIKILRNLVEESEQRHLIGGFVVMAANAGGAWSPVGDVTTTMLWIQGKITAKKTVLHLFVPSLFSGLLPLIFMWKRNEPDTKTNELSEHDGENSSSGPTTLPVKRRRRYSVEEDDSNNLKDLKKREKMPLRVADDSALEIGRNVVTPMKVLVLTVGIVTILLVPLLKISTGLPPYLGMLLALGLLWLLTDALALGGAPYDAADLQGSPAEASASASDHSERQIVETGPPQAGVVAALHKVDLTGLLFFTGILLAVEALDSAGVLDMYAKYIVNLCGGNTILMCVILGISSSVVDNVPLVQAAIDMFDETPVDDNIWQLVALAAGTGGSILSIGSIAGVTLMSMEGVSFLWYLRTIGPWALASFLAGVLVYKIESLFF